MGRLTLWVDAILPRPGGIGRYTLELARGLAARPDLPVRFFGRGRFLVDASILLGDGPLPPRPSRLHRWWDRRELKASLVHGPNYFLPAVADRGIITVHDLSVFRFPETHPAERIAAFEKDFLSSLARATHIITDTETVRGEVMEMFSVPPAMITAIPLGVEPVFRPIAPAALTAPLRQFGIVPKQYGLCVSTLEPRKKIVELLEAWRLLPPTMRQSFPLVLCGGAGWRNEALRAAVARGIAEGWLLHLGFVDEEILPLLYAGAALFVYPSTYEGFGLPPIEAMASGAPVMVAERSCLPEVCGAAARFIDPDDIAVFSAAIGESLSDTIWQEKSVVRGLARARSYSWDRCVDATIAVYRQAL